MHGGSRLYVHWTLVDVRHHAASLFCDRPLLREGPALRIGPRDHHRADLDVPVRERWLSIADRPNYFVSDLGRVRGPRKILKLRPCGPGKYLAIHWAGGTNRYVHLLVLEAFVGPRPPGMEALHGDDERDNNRLDNLSWGTHAVNMKQAKMPRGRDHWNYKHGEYVL